ncbi:MAG: MBL fold metallo-hydrolase [SAR202 cluster bacterium]|nr:MBL fold metallo-hydrolase [SAR202 cluster bacterium]
MARVYVLGAGTPTPTSTRFGSAYVLEAAVRQIMIDCGPATTHKLVKAGLWPTKIDHLFFTHHHFDHDIDYPCFLLCRWDQSIGKENMLQVFGPQPTERITKGLMDEQIGVFSHDWKARVGHPLSQKVYVNRGGKLPRRPPEISAKDILAGKVYSGNDWEVTAAPGEHVQPFLDSLAYRFDTSEGSVVFTGDTQPCESVICLAKNADAMVCMCWDDQDRMNENGEGGGQCGTVGAAQMAQAAGVKSLVLSHIGPHLSKPESMAKGMADIKKVYDGEVIFTDELMTVEVGRKA